VRRYRGDLSWRLLLTFRLLGALPLPFRLFPQLREFLLTLALAITFCLKLALPLALPLQKLRLHAVTMGALGSRTTSGKDVGALGEKATAIVVIEIRVPKCLVACRKIVAKAGIPLSEE
jgi:hypothetical protein